MPPGTALADSGASTRRPRRLRPSPAIANRFGGHIDRKECVVACSLPRVALVCAASFLIPTATRAQQAQQVSSPPAQAAPAPRPPVFNRANDVMPAWLRVRGEFRERIEG